MAIARCEISIASPSVSEAGADHAHVAHDAGELTLDVCRFEPQQPHEPRELRRRGDAGRRHTGENLLGDKDVARRAARPSGPSTSSSRQTALRSFQSRYELIKPMERFFARVAVPPVDHYEVRFRSGNAGSALRTNVPSLRMTRSDRKPVQRLIHPVSQRRHSSAFRQRRHRRHAAPRQCRAASPAAIPGSTITRCRSSRARHRPTRGLPIEAPQQSRGHIERPRVIREEHTIFSRPAL